MTSNTTARRGGSSRHRVDPAAGDDLAAERLAARRRARRERRRRRRGPSASRPAGRRSRGRARTTRSAAGRVGASSGRPTPANSARAGSSVEAAAGQALRRAERRQAEPGERQRMAWPVDDRSEELAARAGRRRGRAARTSGARRVRLPRRGRPRSSRRIARGRPPDRLERMGDGASEWISSTPWAAGRSCRRMATRVSGRIVEQTSWRNPGSVSSAVRVPPPAVAPPRRPGPTARHGRA